MPERLPLSGTSILSLATPALLLRGVHKRYREGDATREVLRARLMSPPW